MSNRKSVCNLTKLFSKYVLQQVKSRLYRNLPQDMKDCLFVSTSGFYKRAKNEKISMGAFIT